MSEEIKHLRVLAKEYATKTMENEWTWHFDYDDCVKMRKSRRDGV